MNKKDELLKIFSIKLRTILSKVNLDYDSLQEIRLRVNAPLLIVYDNREFFITSESELTNGLKDAYIITKNEIRETMEYISNFSLYAFEEELKQGFITITGGHRVGIIGKVVLEDNKIKSMKHISFINIRLSHQVKGCADKVLPYITGEKENECYHTLIISPPRCGKTTLLRDVIRQLSDGSETRPGMTVGVVDERSEIGACYMGVPQNELGIRTDVLDCCPKAKGMLMLIRSMSPRVIAVDEVGSIEDINAIEYVMNCGCKLIATVHGNSIEDIKNKPILGKLVEERMFERYVLLNNHGGVGHLAEIYDEKGNRILKN
jgi:stage III sporulation protein AA